LVAVAKLVAVTVAQEETVQEAQTQVPQVLEVIQVEQVLQEVQTQAVAVAVVAVVEVDITQFTIGETLHHQDQMAQVDLVKS
jgi:hypothetical protein